MRKHRVTILYDVTLRRPACVLLAAAAGTDWHLAKLWPPAMWLTSRTPGMEVLRGTLDEVQRLAASDRLAASESSGSNPEQP